MRTDDGEVVTAGPIYLRQDWTGICNTSFAERVWWNWQLDTSLYPDWAGLAAELSDRGVALLTCVCAARGHSLACAEGYAEQRACVCVGGCVCTGTSTRFCPRTRGPRVPCIATPRRMGTSLCTFALTYPNPNPNPNPNH